MMRKMHIEKEYFTDDHRSLIIKYIPVEQKFINYYVNNEIDKAISLLPDIKNLTLVLQMLDVNNEFIEKIKLK